MNIKDQAKAIRTLLCGIIIAEYGLRQLDDTKQELKFRVNLAIKKCLEVQSWFENSRRASEETKKQFRAEFLSGRMVLLAELVESVWGLEENDLETIIEGIKLNISE